MVRWSEAWSRALLLLLLPAVFPGLSLAGEGYKAEAGSRPPAGAPLDVQRDKDKTVYTIGGSTGDKGNRDTDRAWEMLNNVMIDARGAHGKRPDNNR